MADFTALKTAIQNAIKQNGNEEITGNLLQEVLLAIVTTLGDGSINELITALGSEATTRSQADGTLQQNINAEAQARQQGDSTLQGGINTAMQAINAINNAITNGCVYAGIATPSSTPASGKVFYLALTAGTYTNFNGLEVSQGINILKNNGSTWSLDSFVGIDDAPAPSSQKLVKSGGVFDEVMKNGSAFDLSAYNGGATYADLNAALTALNALPAAYKRGGMSMKYVQSSDNKYVQYRLMTQNFTTDVTQWQGVDEEPTYNSQNLLESGGTYKKINKEEAFVLSGFVSPTSKTLSITSTTLVSTGVTLKANKKYIVYVQANGCVNADYRAGLSNGVTVLYNLREKEFSQGQYVEIIPSSDFVLYVRTLTQGVTVNLAVYEKYGRTLKEVDDDVTANNNNTNRDLIATNGSIVGSIVANNLTRKGAYEATNGNWVDLSSRISSGFIPVRMGDRIDISKSGMSVEYFSIACFNANKEIIVGASVATTKTTITFNVPFGVDYIVLSSVNPDASYTANIHNSITTPYGYNNKIIGYYDFVIPATYQLPSQIIQPGFYKCYLKAQWNGVFTLYIASSNGESYPSITIDKEADWNDGKWFDLNVPYGYSFIAIRIRQVGVLINEFSIYEQQLIPNTTPYTQWYGKKLATYGDSITAINNGDFQYPYPFQPGERQNKSYITWGNMVGRYHKFANVYGRGIGSQKYAWLNGGGAVAWVTPTGDYIARDNTSNKDNFDERLAQGLTSYPTGVTATMEQQGTAIRIRGCGCSWSRITGMFPASIKDTIDVVTIMFYNDHENSIGQETGSIEWVANSNVDTEWASSSYYADYGGDYNISTIRGAIASTIMKFQAWMPNTVIVIMTPQNGVGRIDPTNITSELFTSVSILNKIVKEVREVFSIPLIDYYAESGINMLDGDRYLEEDSIHPYPLEGQIMFARCVIGGLNGIMPQIYRELIVT